MLDSSWRSVHDKLACTSWRKRAPEVHAKIFGRRTAAEATAPSEQGVKEAAEEPPLPGGASVAVGWRGSRRGSFHRRLLGATSGGAGGAGVAGGGGGGAVVGGGGAAGTGVVADPSTVVLGVDSAARAASVVGMGATAAAGA